HTLLNQHLHHIGKSDSLFCLYCPEKTESVLYYLINCLQYIRECHILSNALQCKANSLTHLLISENTINPLMHYINSTGQLKSTFSEVLKE
ncbi:hypothetical protein CY34DRAFT_98973, partial [Suillus luteus UH-Slu-Lm8-n1]